MDSEEVPQTAGMIDQNDIMFLEAVALAEEFDKVTGDPGDPNADQFKAFLEESYVFVFEGFKDNESGIRTTIAMPEEAVLFIIQKAMERAERKATGKSSSITGLTMPPGFTG